MTDATASSADTRWWVFKRVQDVRSALLVNVVRTFAVLAFYGNQVWYYFSLPHATRVDEQVHYALTAVVIAWLLICLAIFLACQKKFLPPFAKYLSTLADCFLLTSVASIGGGASSWIVICYLLIIASSTMRFDSRLVCASTGLSLFCYGALVARSDSNWTDGLHHTPLHQIVTVLVAILTAGILGWITCQNLQNFIKQEGRVTEEQPDSSDNAQPTQEANNE